MTTPDKSATPTYKNAPRPDHRIVVRFDLTTPVVIEQGKRINRRAGYWLPVSVRMVEVTARRDGDKLPTFYATGHGHSVTKAGGLGAGYSVTMRRMDRPDGYGYHPAPPEIAALIELVEAMTQDLQPWPAPAPR